MCVWINEWKSTLHLPKLFFYSFSASCSTQHTIVLLYKFSNNEILYYRRDVCISGIIFFLFVSLFIFRVFFFLLFTSFNELKMSRKKTCLNQFWMSHSYRSPFSKLRSLYWWIVSHQFKLIYKHVHNSLEVFFLSELFNKFCSLKIEPTHTHKHIIDQVFTRHTQRLEEKKNFIEWIVCIVFQWKMIFFFFRLHNQSKCLHVYFVEISFSVQKISFSTFFSIYLEWKRDRKKKKCQSYS